MHIIRVARVDLIEKVNFIKELKEVRESAKRLSGEKHSCRQSAEQAL